MLLFTRIARFAVGHEDALLSEGLHHGCQERDPPDGDEQLKASLVTVFAQATEFAQKHKKKKKAEQTKGGIVE